jgi:hypothetical protein
MSCGERSTAVTASDARGMAKTIFRALVAASDARGVADTIFGAVMAASNATGLADAIFGAVGPCSSSLDSASGGDRFIGWSARHHEGRY